MLERTQCKKDSNKSQYDPQVGQAAAANSALAERTQAWTEDFYAKHVSPLLEASATATAKNTEQQGQLFDLNMSEAKLADERYRTLGVPAEDAYYKMVKDYSAPEEQERQAQGAIGDSRAAQANTQAQLMRKFAGLGIDPTSPAGMAAMSDQAVQNAAATAAASTRARTAAKTLGMALTSDAANFGRGGASAITQFGGAAAGNSSNAAGVAQGAVGAGVSGAAPVQNAAGIASRAYGANLDAYTGLAKADMEAQGQSAAGLGQLIGLVGSAAIGASDRRLKKRIRQIATLSKGLILYAFNYIWDPDGTPERKGCMADEVRRVYPEAVIRHPSGYDMVDYSKVMV